MSIALKGVVLKGNNGDVDLRAAIKQARTLQTIAYVKFLERRSEKSFDATPNNGVTYASYAARLLILVQRA